MTAPVGRTKSRVGYALVSACVTVVAVTAMAAIWSSPSSAQIDTTLPGQTTTTRPTTTTTGTPTTPTTNPPDEWGGSRWTGPTANGETVSDGTFTGTFVYQPGTPPIASTDLTVSYSNADVHPPACQPAPGHQPQQSASTTPTTPSTDGPEASRMDFLFEVAFTCNGIYDAKATAALQGSQSSVTTHDLTLTGLRVAVPPSPPLAFVATDNGNHTVTLTWQPPNRTSPDLTGYRVSRRDPANPSYSALGETPTTARSFDDTTIPTSGGSYFYKVETLRQSPNGPLTSDPVVTADALAVGGGSGAGGGSVGGVAVPRNPGGASHFDEPTTLAADEGEPGAGDLAVPGAGTIQRFAGRDGAGLIKPFAAALDLAVWAGLLLFLTRRAASAARADALALELEHSA